MAIVARGLGQPEAGAIVTAGLGASETDPNAITAHLFGTGALTADLTASGGNALVATLTGSSTLTAALIQPETADQGSHSGGGWPRPKLFPQPPKLPFLGPSAATVSISASIGGSSALTAEITFSIDLDAELEMLLLLDLV